MLQAVTIEPARITIADLEVLEAQHSSAIMPIEPVNDALPPLTKRDVRQRLIASQKIMNWLCGGDMRDEINSTDFLVRRIDVLEAQHNQLQRENAELRKALSAVGTVLEVHDDPFALKPPSKWSKAELGNLIINVGESIKWVMQRAENALDPAHAVPIVADPE